MMSLLLFGLIVLLLALRQNLIAILFFSAAYIHMVYGDGQIQYLLEDMWNAVNKEVFLSIPLFMLVGSVMTKGSIAIRLVDVMRRATCALPGGLGAASILSCAFFAAISGSSMVTLLAVGSILYPALLNEGYDKKYALGAITSAGTLGVIIPPSIPLIVYGIITETSITDLFLAGLIPGLLLTAVLLTYSLIRNRHLPKTKFDARAFFSAIRDGIWSLLMPVILLGGIYSGYFTATESAAVALAYAMFVEFVIYREMTLHKLAATVVETSQLLGTLVPIIAIAMSLNILLTTELVPQSLAQWLTTNIESKILFILGVNLLLLAVGCLMDINAAILIMAPILMPIASSYGIDPVHFGIIMVINLEIGLLTPPVGFNLVVAMTAFKEKFSDVTSAAVPFVGIMLLVLIAVSFFPWLSLTLL
ncbi:MAG: TRAP transporter large permease subunit [Tateyamaria sp.]|jgi:C4-dicarboxylate transporter, DctM subunit|uniref:TRAP transporter large permease n=1 Tax=Tateyamaria sp. TaxID=1929288 RepID=UPI0032DC53B8